MSGNVPPVKPNPDPAIIPAGQRGPAPGLEATQAGPSLGQPAPRASMSGPTVPLATADPQAPPTIPGYEIQQELGRGGMGVVYLARHLALNRLVALKMILSSEYATADQLVRFRLEGEALARVQHPSIVQIYEVGTHASRPFFALEYVSGGSLSRVLSQGNLSYRQTAELTETLARGMHSAHLKGIVHRDLKPGNILLNPRADARIDPNVFDLDSWTPKITDFGLAKQIGAEAELTQTGFIVGTPEYMAPEQVLGRYKDIGPATDVYSLGTILYRMLAGQVPFEGESAMDLLKKVAEEDPTPPSRRRRTVPLDLESICLKCLQKDPQKRYTSAEDLADDLRRYLDGRPIEARPVTKAERLWKAARRHPVLATAVGLIAVGVLLGFPLVTGLWLRAQSARDDAERSARSARSAQEKETRQRQSAERARDLAKQAEVRAVNASRDAEKARQTAEQARRESEAAWQHAAGTLYVSRIARARLEWRLNNIARAVTMLELCNPQPGWPDFRGWEWHYLNNLIHADLVTVPNAHTAFVQRVVFSPDGKRIVSAGGSPFRGVKAGSVAVWATRTGAPQLRFEQEGFPQDVSFSDDGKFVAGAGGSNTVLLRAGDSGQVVRKLDHPAEVRHLDFSPDGRRLATIDDNKLFHIWDTTTGKEVIAPQQHEEKGRLLYSPDGKRIGLAGRGKLILLDPNTGKATRTIRIEADDFAFSPDGSRLVTSGSVPQIWNVETGKSLMTLNGHDGPVKGVAFRPDGLEVATAGADSTVRLWSAETGKQTMVLRGHRGRVATLAYHPDGVRLVSGSQQPAELKVWDLTRQPEYVTALRRSGAIEGLAFSNDGAGILASFRGGDLETRSASTGLLGDSKQLDITGKWQTPAQLTAFDAKGQRLAAIGKKEEHLTVYEAATGKALSKFPLRHPVFHVAMSDNGRRVAFSGLRGDRRHIVVGAADTGKILANLEAQGVPSGGLTGAVALGPSGHQVAFDAYRIEESDGKVAVTPEVHIVNVSNGRTDHVIPGSNQLITALAFNQAGTRLAIASASGQLLIASLVTGQPIRAMQNPTALSDLAFSPDGLRLAGATRETVTIWDANSGEEIIALRGAPPRTGDRGFNPKVSWSPDGQRLGSSNWNHSVSVWDATARDTPAGRRRRLKDLAVRRYAWHLSEAEAHRADAAILRYHLDYLKNHKPPTPAQAQQRDQVLNLSSL